MLRKFLVPTTRRRGTPDRLKDSPEAVGFSRHAKCRSQGWKQDAGCSGVPRMGPFLPNYAPIVPILSMYVSCHCLDEQANWAGQASIAYPTHVSCSPPCHRTASCGAIPGQCRLDLSYTTDEAAKRAECTVMGKKHEVDLRSTSGATLNRHSLT